HPVYLLRHQNEKTNHALSAWWKQADNPSSKAGASIRKSWSLADPRDLSLWRHDGPGVGEVSPPGSFALASEGETIVAGIYPSGVYSHLISTKDRGVLISPRFNLDEKYDLWLRVAGDGGAAARYVVQNYPRDGSVFPVTKLSGGQWQWVKLGLDY